MYTYIYLFLFIYLCMYSCLSSWGRAATCFWRRMQRLRLRQFDTSNFKAPSLEWKSIRFAQYFGQFP